MATLTNPVTNSTVELVHKLCESVFQHTMNSSGSMSLQSSFQGPTKQIHWGDRDNSAKIQEHVKLFFDIVILRRWEWHGLSVRALDGSMSPLSSCLSFSYCLHCQGNHSEAFQLLEAVNTLTSNRVCLVETEAILTFLTLLASENMVKNAWQLKQPVVTDYKFRYESYPSSLFDNLTHVCPVADSNEAYNRSIQLFECLPGTGFNSYFTLPPGIEDKTNSLYDGLVHCTVDDVNAYLGLPGLPTQQDDISLLANKVCAAGSNYKTHDGTSSVPTSHDSASCDNWSLESRLELFSAINIDQPGAVREWEGWKESSKQYLCDNCDTCFPHAVRLCLSRYCSMAHVDISTVDKENILPARQMITSLDSLPISAPQKGGIVNWNFFSTVQSILDHFRANLHQLAGDSTDVLLSASAHWILPIVQFLMSFWTEVIEVPKGLALLDALYNQAYKLQGTSYYLVMLNLLAHSITPYLKFLEQWVFQGWLDLGEAFGLHANEEALAKRDEHYWNKGYTVSRSGCTPNFFSEHTHTILTCGKALNLLRICKPSHPLCTGVFHPPKLHMVMSVNSLEKCHILCQQYRTEVSENANIREELFREELQAREQEVRAEMINARWEARAHAEKLRKLEEAYLAQAKEKKVAFRTELIEQMEINQALRLEQEAEQRLEDKKTQDYLTMKEKVTSDKEALLQQKVKEEMVAYYAELSKEADKRRMRAEWRVQRIDLSSKRQELLKFEREELFNKMEVKKSPRHFYKTPSTTSEDYGIGTMTVRNVQQELFTPILAGDTSSGHVEGDGPQSNKKQRKRWISSMTGDPISLETISEQSCDRQTGHDSVDSLDTGDVFQKSGNNAQSGPTLLFGDSFVNQDKREGFNSEVVQSDISKPLDSHSTNNRIKSIVSQSVAQELLYNEQRSTITALSHTSTRGAEQPSIAQDIIYYRNPASQVQPHLVSEDGIPRLVSSRGHEPPSVAQNIIYCSGENDVAEVSIFNSRGTEPLSKAQDIIYGADQTNQTNLPYQEPGHPRLVSSRGHAPASTIQLKMYPLRYIEQPTPEAVILTSEAKEENITAFSCGPSISYRDKFSILNDVPTHDMLDAVLGPVDLISSPDDIDPEFLSIYPISALLEQSTALPILTQSTLVNEALLRYFLSECQIHRHFTAMRWFLLLEDGEFGHVLSTKLCEELAYGRNWKLLCSASFLNPILTAALEVSLHRQCPEAQRISFALKFKPQSINTHDVDALEFLQLKYEVDWPCNIVITSTSMDRYNRVLQLLFQMKRASWALKNTFHQLKVSKGLTRLQLRQLQAYRHEFQHFVNVMHGYITNQLFHLSWREFKVELKDEVHSLEELIQAHHNFVNKAIFRCLLSKKALPVMKLIHSIFSFILKFSNQLAVESDDIQLSYSAMSDTHKRYREISGLLIKVVQKLVQRGYQPHLEDFLLRLNFNDFYR